MVGIMVNENFFNAKTISDLNKQFTTAEPYPHLIFDDFLDPELAEQIATEFPGLEEPVWYEYNNPIEKKLACDDLRKFPVSIAKAIHFFNSQSFLTHLEKITGIQGLQSDPYLHGGGIHCTKSEGKLDMHLDYSIHPKLKLERRLNAIIYLSPNWLPEYGGYLELWNKDMSQCIKKVEPKFNRIILFATSDISYHGHPEPAQSPENVTRNSIALYYLTEPQPNCSRRPRALFVARPQDSKSEALEKFRKARSEVTGVY